MDLINLIVLIVLIAQKVKISTACERVGVTAHSGNNVVRTENPFHLQTVFPFERA